MASERAVHPRDPSSSLLSTRQKNWQGNGRGTFLLGDRDKQASLTFYASTKMPIFY